ncbi:MAG: PAS domain S-box protein, partial [Chloroflexi bacterium]|nr:PAS domain S-box protein [Chloroflexota bacterium]
LYDEARRIADKLYKSERDYRSLFENAHDAIWFHNFDGIMLAANTATQKLTGYDVEFLIGMNVSHFLSNDKLQLARKVRQKLLASEVIEQPYEQELMRKDGTVATVMLTSSLITFDGQPVGFQHIARDITDEMRMQDNLRFYLQQITQAQEEERKRIARELHDDTAQSLFAISRQIDNFMRSDSALDRQQLSFLQEMRHRICDALQDVKRFSQDLRPPIIDDLGLLPAIQWLLKQIQDEHGVKSKLTVLGQERRFTPEVELILFRITQEALSNAYRHARASKVDVIFEFSESSICIVVSDNGRGFKVPDNFGDLSRSGKLGLLGMQERVSLLNGNIDVKSEPKKGTIVTVRASV